jgi:hypothetical protein
MMKMMDSAALFFMLAYVAALFLVGHQCKKERF